MGDRKVDVNCIYVCMYVCVQKERCSAYCIYVWIASCAPPLTKLVVDSHVQVRVFI